jgi:phospholipid/cholesterol/gamma-HCH transport system substrate-binding protein
VTVDRLNSVIAKLEKGDGSAAKLLNDPGLYNDLRSVLNRVDSLTADFKKNPRRYIDLRIF